MFTLNQEEMQVLEAIRDLNDGNLGKRTDYYDVVKSVDGDTAKLIPVVARLDVYKRQPFDPGGFNRP